MPGGRFPGSWSSTCDRPCHGYRRRSPPPTVPRCSGVPRSAGCGPPTASPPQVLVGVDQHAPAVEGPLPDLLARDRVRGRRLPPACAGLRRRAVPRIRGRAWYSGTSPGHRRRGDVSRSRPRPRPPGRAAYRRQTGRRSAGRAGCRARYGAAARRRAVPISGSAAATIASAVAILPAPASPRGASMPSAASMSDSASAAPRPSEQPTSSDITSGQVSHKSARRAMTRRCAASSSGSAASQARPVSAPAAALPSADPGPGPAIGATSPDTRRSLRLVIVCR